jgi:hypothetical protein
MLGEVERAKKETVMCYIKIIGIHQVPEENYESQTRHQMVTLAETSRGSR